MSDHEIQEEGLTRREALKRGAILGGVALAWTTPAVQIVGMSPAFATTTSPVPGEGCSHGYWKNHEEAWAETGLLPSTTLKGAGFDCTDRDNRSLMEALKPPQPKTDKDILLVQAVAALLNAAHPLVGFPWTPGYVQSSVNVALCAGSGIEGLKNQLDSMNNAHGSPLCGESSEIYDSILNTEEAASQNNGKNKNEDD